MPQLPFTVEGFAIFVVLAVILAIILVFMGIKSVPQGMEFTVERFGKYTRTLSPLGVAKLG